MKLKWYSITLFVIGVAVTLGPALWQHDPLEQNIDQRLAPMSFNYPLGTDQFGRDMLARIMVGGRWSLVGAAIVSLGTTGLGFMLGAMAAMGPKWLDHIIRRLTEVFQAVPGVLLALALTALLRPSFANFLLALVLTNWTWYSRMYRSMIRQALSAAHIEGTRALGASYLHIVTRHILPNIVSPVIVIATLNFGAVLLNVSALSFIGLGLPPPTPEWGNLINESRNFFQRVPLLMIAPGLCIAITVLSVNLLGNDLRDQITKRQGFLQK